MRIFSKYRRWAQAHPVVISLLLIVGVISGLVNLWLLDLVPGRTAYAQSKVQYKAAFARQGMAEDTPALQQAIDRATKDGWELIAVVPYWAPFGGKFEGYALVLKK